MMSRLPLLPLLRKSIESLATRRAPLTYTSVAGALGAAALLLGTAGHGFGEESDAVAIFDAQTGEVVLMKSVRKSEEEWKKQLTPEQYHVTREKGTERPFTGALLHNKQRGMYQCVACRTDLFSSETKYESGTGWPSFWAPASEHNVRLEEDTSFFMRRTEVRCARCGAHLGHVFDDGPKPTGLRYCINSVALAFQQQDPSAPSKPQGGQDTQSRP